jgi:hypothetical protein
MSQVPVKQQWVGTWVRVGLSALLLMTWGGTAHGQSIEQAQEMNQNMEWYMEIFRWLGTGIFILGLVGAAVLVGMVAVRVYMRTSATTDPMKLALSDPWVRAHLEQWQAARSAPAEGAVAAPAEPTPAEPADVPGAAAPTPLTNS